MNSAATSTRLCEIAVRYNLRQQEREIRDRQRDASLGMMVLVVGEGNFGKSSLLNALSGIPGMAEVSKLPKTYKVDIYTAARADEPDHVFMRTVSQPEGREMSCKEAACLCAADEANVDRDRKSNSPIEPQILETITRLKHFALGPDLCLVDTPGLAQALLGHEAELSSLVKGLEDTYIRVEQVWAKWYDRADVVLWCIAADKMSANQTDWHLRRLKERYRKYVVPVLTKADLVMGQTARALDQFEKQYGSLFGGDRPFVTTCAGTRSDFRDVGINELRAHLLSLANEAAPRKRQATETALSDAASHIGESLFTAADTTVGNLRVIASAADDVAAEGLRQFRQSLGRIQAIGREYTQRVSSLKSVLLEMDRDLKDHWKQMRGLFQLWPSSEQERALLQLASQRIERHLQTIAALNEVQDALQYSGEGLEDLARAVGGRPEYRLRKVGLDQSGRRWSDNFTMIFALEIPPALPPPESGPQLLINLPNTFDLIWRGILKVFNRSRAVPTALTAEEATFVREVGKRMNDHILACLDHTRSSLIKGVAEPLATAVDRTFAKASDRALDEVLGTIDALDKDMTFLAALAPAGSIPSASFGRSARYWTSTDQDAELARQVAADHLGPQLKDLVNRVVAFPGRPAQRIGFRPGLLVSRREVRKDPESVGRVRASLAALGFLPAKLVVHFDLVKALPALCDGGRFMFSPAPLLLVIVRDLKAWLEAGEQSKAIESSLNQHFSGTFASAGLASAIHGRIAPRYTAAMSAAAAEIRHQTAVEEPVLVRWGLVLSPRLPPGAVVGASFTAGVATAVAWEWDEATGIAVVVFALLLWLSHAAVRFRLRWAMGRVLCAAGAEASRAASARAAKEIGVPVIIEALQVVSDRITPRPLQRALQGRIED